MHRPSPLSVGAAANLACTLEVTAAKAGNVFPGQEFSDLGVADFFACAAVCTSVFDNSATMTLGEIVLECVKRSSSVSQSNANLGIILLLAPLCKAASANPNFVKEDVCKLLGELTTRDGKLVYEAIRLSTPGGMGEVNEMDVSSIDSVDLMEAMRASTDRDKIAEQYATNFAFVLDTVVPCLEEAMKTATSIFDAITQTQIRLLGQAPDTLIARKCGKDFSEEVSRRALQLRGSLHPSDPSWIEFDRWLREDGNRRNPGTTADLIAAGLFVSIYSGRYARLTNQGS